MLEFHLLFKARACAAHDASGCGGGIEQEERELLACVSSADWANTPVHLKWRALAWYVCACCVRSGCAHAFLCTCMLKDTSVKQPSFLRPLPIPPTRSR